MIPLNSQNSRNNSEIILDSTIITSCSVSQNSRNSEIIPDSTIIISIFFLDPTIIISCSVSQNSQNSGESEIIPQLFPDWYPRISRNFGNPEIIPDFTIIIIFSSQVSQNSLEFPLFQKKFPDPTIIISCSVSRNSRNSGIPKVLRIPQLLFLARYPRIPGIPEFQGIRNSGYSEIIPDPTIIFTSQVSQNSRNSEIIPDSTITVSSLVSQNFPEFRGSRSYYFQLPGIPEFPEFRGFRNYSASHNYFQLPGFPVTLFPEFRNSEFGIPGIIPDFFFRIPQLMSIPELFRKIIIIIVSCLVRYPGI